MAHDILSGLLPTGNPLAPFDAAAARRAVAVDADADASQKRGQTPFLEPSDFAAPVVQPPAARRSRRSLAGPLVAAFAVLLFAAVGACLYLLISGLGISPEGDVVAVNAAPQKPAATRPAPAIVENESPENESPENESPGNEAARLPRSILPSENGSREDVPSETPASDAATGDTTDGGEASDGNPSRDADATPEAMESTTPGDEANAAAVEQSEPAWDLVEQTLRGGRFAEMPEVTAAAVRQASTPEQRERAQRLHRLAQWAAQYDEAVRGGAAGLGAGETFELAPDLRVLVVESNRDAITLKFDGRNKTYSLDSVPLVLAHSLARFVLPDDDPVAVAARGAYQALWPQASDAHRRQSFQWWRDLEGSGVAGDAAELEPVVRVLYDMPAE